MNLRLIIFLLIVAILSTLFFTTLSELVVMNSILTSMAYFMCILTIFWLIVPFMGGDFFVIKDNILWKIKQKPHYEYEKTALQVNKGGVVIAFIASNVMVAWVTWLLLHFNVIATGYREFAFNFLVIARTILWILVWPVFFLLITTLVSWIISPPWWKDKDLHNDDWEKYSH